MLDKYRQGRLKIARNNMGDERLSWFDAANQNRMSFGLKPTTAGKRPEAFYKYEALATHLSHFIGYKTWLKKGSPETPDSPIKEKLTKDGWIYVWLDATSIRIGHEKTKRTRIKTHTGSNPGITVLLEYPGTSDEEQGLHKKFRHLNLYPGTKKKSFYKRSNEIFDWVAEKRRELNEA